MFSGLPSLATHNVARSEHSRFSLFAGLPSAGVETYFVGLLH